MNINNYLRKNGYRPQIIPSGELVLKKNRYENQQQNTRECIR